MKLTNFQIEEISNAVVGSMEECGCCDVYHPLYWEGDCREDDYRYFPDELIGVLLAGPDLLKALKGLFEHCCMVHKHWGDNDNTKAANEAISKAEQAIKKAEG